MATLPTPDTSTEEQPQQQRKLGRPPRAVTKRRAELLIEQLQNDVPVCEALRNAGYSEGVASRGWASVPESVIEHIVARDARFGRIGHALIKKPDETEARIVGKMYHEMMNGEKQVPVAAAKVLTTHKSVAHAFVQDLQQNVVVIQAPSDWKPAPATKTVEQLPSVSQQELPDFNEG